MPQQSHQLKALLKTAGCLIQSSPSTVKRPQQLKVQISEHFGIGLDDLELGKDLRLVCLLVVRLITFWSAIQYLPLKILGDDELGVIKNLVEDGQVTAEQHTLISTSYLAFFDDVRQLQLALKEITCFSALRCLVALDNQLAIDCASSSSEEPTDTIPIFGTRDSQTIHGLGDMLSNWGIYHNLAKDGNSLGTHIDQPKLMILKQFEQKLSLPFLALIEPLVNIVLPNPSGCSNSAETHNGAPNDRLTRILDPRLSLRTILLPCLFVPLTAGLINAKLDPTSDLSGWANQKLDDLLSLANPKKVFACLLSLSSSLSRNSILSNSAIAFRAEVSNILSSRLLRPGGVRGLLQAVMTDEYDEDEDTEPPESTKNASTYGSLPSLHSTSATLNRLNSIAHIMCNCPRGLKADDYLNQIVRGLLNIIAPEFLPRRLISRCGQPPEVLTLHSTFKNNSPRPNGITKAACYVISQIILKHPTFYKRYLGPLLHSSFIPCDASSSSPSTEVPDNNEPICEDGQFDPVVVQGSEITDSICLLKVVVSNSNPSDILISALVLPILPQLLSLWLHLRRTRSEPYLRDEINSLLLIWVKLCSVEQVVHVITKCIRELEIGRELNLIHVEGRDGWRYWSRDCEGQSCIRIARNKTTADFSDEISAIKPDPDGVADWLGGLKHDKLNSKLLVKWLDELDVLRLKEGLMEAKMTLFRMQMVLKMIEKLDSSVVQEPLQILEFVKHSFSSLSEIDSDKNLPNTPSRLNDDTPRSHEDTINLPSSLNFLKLGQAESSVTNERVDDDDVEEADNSLILTGLTLLLTVLEANPSLDELSAPSLISISEKLDYIILRCSNVRPEVNELSLKCRIMLSVRKALAQVDQLTEPPLTTNSSSTPRQLREQILSTYEEGLKLIEDPCLPIRAQGIILLKDLLGTHGRTGEDVKLMSDLAANVLDVLLKLIEEEDSFIYLNAIKALSELAEQYSDLICVKLNKIYALSHLMENASAGTLFTADQRGIGELDKRLRIGEAMMQIVQRAGQALPKYLKYLLPSLLFALSSKDFPACLRWSALTILTTCVETSMTTMLPYITDLMDSCLMILSLESRPVSTSKSVTNVNNSTHDQQKDENVKENVKENFQNSETDPDSDEEPHFRQVPNPRSTTCRPRLPEETVVPVSIDTDHPALRRAAVMFLLSSLSLHADMVPGHWKHEYLVKTIRVLKYVKLVDPDGLVQYQAGAALDRLDDIR